MFEKIYEIYGADILYLYEYTPLLKNSNANFICKTPQDMFSLLKKHVEFL